MIAPEWVAVSGFGRRRSLSDLAVWGFPETFPENLPPQALPTPFHPFFSPSTLSPNSFTPKTPPSNSLAPTFISLCYPPTLLFSPNSFPSSQVPYRTSSEHLRDPSIGSPQKAPKRPFLGLFMGFPPKPLKGSKTPFLGPF